MKLSGDAKEIYRRITALINSRIALEESRKLLSGFKPTSEPSEILARQKKLKEAFEKIDVNLKSETSKVRPFRLKRSYFSDRVFIATEDEFEEASSLSVCTVELEPINAPLILSRSASVGIEVDEISDVELAPEMYVESVIEQRDVLESVAKVMESFKGRGKSVAGQLLDSVKLLEEIYNKKKQIESIFELISQEEAKLNERIEKKVREKSLRLEGDALLEFLKTGSFPMDELEEIILEEIFETEKNISEKLGSYVEIFPRNLKIPVRADVGAVEKLREEIERDLNLEFYLESRKVARRIKAMLPELEREIQEVYSIELIRGIKEFCQDFTFPEISHKGIGFLEGKNLFIENPQPISYFLGQSDQIHTAPIPEIGNYNVIVLTGANSGGKTSLLELITQIQILAQMGLPVNASRCHIDVVDELFLFRRKKSVYGAGAFENAVKTLSRILQGDGKKLILVDEFEAITEPGAAIRIVSKILEIAHRKGHYFVLVSHLGEHLKFDFVRVDGIEAEGLDDDLNLIVDRQPKFGVVGRSTPELIVERLYRKSKGEIRSIFKELLEAVRRLDKGQEAEEVVEVDDKRG